MTGYNCLYHTWTTQYTLMHTGHRLIKLAVYMSTCVCRHMKANGRPCAGLLQTTKGAQLTAPVAQTLCIFVCAPMSVPKLFMIRHARMSKFISQQILNADVEFTRWHKTWRLFDGITFLLLDISGKMVFFFFFQRQKKKTASKTVKQTKV